MTSPQLTLLQWKALINNSPELFSLKVISESMLPALEMGDEVLISPTIRLPRRGEVTVFFREHLQPQLVVHRCLGGLKFSGDNSMVYDQGVEAEHILGVVYQFKRAGELRALAQKVPRFKESMMLIYFIKTKLKRAVKKFLRLFHKF